MGNMTYGSYPPGAAPYRVPDRLRGPRQDAELESLLALGARPADVGQPGKESWHVLADPEGNEFCLLRQRLVEL
jgi:Glyoxalase-like domain